MAFHSMIVFLTLPVAYESPTTPNKLGLGCSLFARRLLRESLRFLFFRVLRYFSSPTYQLDTLHVKLLWFESEGVTPFGHRRIEAFCQLPGDFRGLKTSFFGSYCLGIRYLLFANKLNLKFCYFWIRFEADSCDQIASLKMQVCSIHLSKNQLCWAMCQQAVTFKNEKSLVGGHWWTAPGSNRPPLHCKWSALPDELAALVLYVNEVGCR